LLIVLRQLFSWVQLVSVLYGMAHKKTENFNYCIRFINYVMNDDSKVFNINQISMNINTSLFQ